MHSDNIFTVFVYNIYNAGLRNHYVSIASAQGFFSRCLKANTSNETTIIVLETTNSPVGASIHIILEAVNIVHMDPHHCFFFYFSTYDINYYLMKIQTNKQTKVCLFENVK